MNKEEEVILSSRLGPIHLLHHRTSFVVWRGKVMEGVAYLKSESNLALYFPIFR